MDAHANVRMCAQLEYHHDNEDHMTDVRSFYLVLFTTRSTACGKMQRFCSVFSRCQPVVGLVHRGAGLVRCVRFNSQVGGELSVSDNHAQCVMFKFVRCT